MSYDDLIPDAPPSQQPIDADRAPALVDTSPTADDGRQDVDQEPGYEEAETEEPQEPEDPAVHKVA